MWSQIKYCIKRDKVACLGWLGLIVSFAFIFHIIYWMLYPYKPLVIHNSPYPVYTPVVQRGSNAEMRATFTKFVDIPGHIAQSIDCEDGGHTALRGVDTTRGIGYYDQTLIIYVPKNAPLGRCHFIFNVEYDINPIRHINIHAESEYFTITE